MKSDRLSHNKKAHKFITFVLIAIASKTKITIFGTSETNGRFLSQRNMICTHTQRSMKSSESKVFAPCIAHIDSWCGRFWSNRMHFFAYALPLYNLLRLCMMTTEQNEFQKRKWFLRHSDNVTMRFTFFFLPLIKFYSYRICRFESDFSLTDNCRTTNVPYANAEVILRLWFCNRVYAILPLLCMNFCCIHRNWFVIH